MVSAELAVAAVVAAVAQFDYVVGHGSPWQQVKSQPMVEAAMGVAMEVLVGLW